MDPDKFVYRLYLFAGVFYLGLAAISILAGELGLGVGLLGVSIAIFAITTSIDYQIKLNAKLDMLDRKIEEILHREILKLLEKRIKK